MTPDELLAQAERGEFGPLYLLVGDEQYLQAALVRALRDATLRQGVPGLNEDQWVAGDVDANAVVSAARTLPMMARRRWVLVRCLERWEKPEGATTSASALDRLAEYAENPTPSSTLVLVASKLDKRRRLYVAAKNGGWLVACDPLSRDELPRWIARRARELGHSLGDGVADLIAELAGPELSSVADAVERVSLYVGQNQLITEDAVAETIVRVRPATVWELVGAVGNREAGAALAALERVYDPQDRGLRLVGVLAWSARQLLKFESAIRAGLPPPEAAKRAGAAPFKARELSFQLRRTSPMVLERWLETLAEVDQALKGGSRRPPKAVLEHAILGMCSTPTRQANRPPPRTTA